MPPYFNRIVYFLLVILPTVRIPAQQDSLSQLINSADNAEKCLRLISIAKAMRSAQVDSAIYLSQLSVETAKNLQDTSLIIKSHFALADNYYWGLSDFPKTKKQLDTIKNLYFENLSNPEKARYYSQSGDVVYFAGEHVRSMENYYKALDFVEADSVLLARLYHNLGWVYADLGKYDKAIYYGQQALYIAELIHGDRVHKMNGLVYIYQTAKMFDKALEYTRKVEQLDPKNPGYYSYQKAALYIGKGDTLTAISCYEQGIGLARKNNSTRWLMNNLHYAAKHLILTGRQSLAMPYFKEYEKLSLKYDKEYEVSALYALLGKSYLDHALYDSSKFYLDKAEKIQLKNHQPEIGKTYKILSDWHLITGKIQNSRGYLVKYIAHSDSLKKEEEKIAAKAKDDILKMYELENSLNAKDSEITKRNLQIEKEKFQKYGFLGGLIVALFLAIYVFKNLRSRQRTNKILAEKNLLIEKQKKEVESKNRETLDSIHYAKRIQQAILKEAEHISEHLPPYFILFKPKDIVSGDFHWIMEKDSRLYMAVADCTGHGVPGAFMSMLGIAFLNDICSSDKILSPAEVLNILRERIIKELNQKGTKDSSKDGMDISLLSLEFEVQPGVHRTPPVRSESKIFPSQGEEREVRLQWAGANNGLIIIRNNEIIELKPDKQPIGYFPQMSPFANHEFMLKKNDVIYLFSDGYADQFGGPKGKKFKYRKMQELLLKNHTEEMNKQKDILSGTIEEWMGTNEQTDDICLIGARI